MGRRAKVPAEEKLKALEDFLSGRRRVTQICLDLEIHHRSFYDWLRKYQIKGVQGLQPSRNNTCYPEAIKLQAVKDYNKGVGSLDYICNKYGISGHRVLLDWIKKYNGRNI